MIETESLVTRTAREQKIKTVERRLQDVKNLLERAVELLGGSLFMIIDDFYFLRPDDQAPVADYLHSLSKNNRVYLKFGTIRYRTVLYKRNSTIRGLQQHHDIMTIDLDHTLQYYHDVSTFLRDILNSLYQQVRMVDPESIFAGDSWNQLVLASGGVPRDFLNIFRRSIEVGRTKKIPRITKMTINEASYLYYKDTKKDDLGQDIGEDKQDIDALLEDIIHFCVEISRKNCFLLDKSELNSHADLSELIKELVDYRLIHLVHHNTGSARHSGRFEAYALDLGTFAHPERRGEKRVKVVEFWRQDEKSRFQEIVHSPLYTLRSMKELLRLHQERAKEFDIQAEEKQKSAYMRKEKEGKQMSFWDSSGQP